MGNQYVFFVSGNAPMLYPTISYFGLFRIRQKPAAEIPQLDPYKEEWGEIISSNLLIEMDEMPDMIDMVYLSLVEKRFYSLEMQLPQQKMQQIWNQGCSITPTLFSHIVVGMAPYGKVAIWFNGLNKSLLLSWLEGEETFVESSELVSNSKGLSLEKVCDFYINQDPRVRENLEQNGLPPRDLFDNYMKQFTYRYVPVFEMWDEAKGEWRKYNEEEEKKGLPELDYIEEALFDGTHDKLHDGGLMKYHEAGKPKKLAVKWHIKKSEWSAYFWFEDEEIRRVYDRFYGTHADTKTDFMLRIDPWHDRYELALYRHGLPQPQVIPQRAYQMLVFRNKFECYRSENYSQPKGAWIW